MRCKEAMHAGRQQTLQAQRFQKAQQALSKQQAAAATIHAASAVAASHHSHPSHQPWLAQTPPMAALVVAMAPQQQFHQYPQQQQMPPVPLGVSARAVARVPPTSMPTFLTVPAPLALSSLPIVRANTVALPVFPQAAPPAQAPTSADNTLVHAIPAISTSASSSSVLFTDDYAQPEAQHALHLTLGDDSDMMCAPSCSGKTTELSLQGWDALSHNVLQLSALDNSGDSWRSLFAPSCHSTCSSTTAWSSDMNMNPSSSSSSSPRSPTASPPIAGLGDVAVSRSGCCDPPARSILFEYDNVVTAS